MRNRSDRGIRPRRLRRMLMAMALAIGVSAGVFAAPLPASADPSWIIPPGGWCYNNWYVFGSDNGQYQQPYGPTKYLNNQTSSPVQWTEQLQVSTTFSSSYTSTQDFHAGLDVLIIKVSVEQHIQRTTSWSITVNQTTTFQVTVPPHTLMYAQYGADMEATSGTYYEEQFECGTYDFDTVTSGAVTGSSLLAVGWRLWEG